MDGELVSCNFNANPELGGEAALCVIPTHRLPVVEDPVRMKVKPNVMSEWLDRLTARGAGILLVHGKWFDNMWTSAAMATRGVDYFSRIEARMAAAIEGALSRGWATPGRVVLMGRLAPRLRHPRGDGQEPGRVRRGGAPAPSCTGRA